MAESIISPGVFTRENDTSYITPAPIQAGAAFVGPTVKGPQNQPLIVTSYGDYVRKFGETYTSASNKQYEFLTSVAVKNYFQNGGQTALVTRVANGTYTPAMNTTIVASTGSITAQPFTLRTLGTGVIYNNNSGSTYNSGSTQENSDGSLKSGSVDNLRWEIANVNPAIGTFNIFVRQGTDNTNNKSILETFNVSLDPSSDKYIERVIGNQYTTVGTDGSTSYNYVVGEYPNASNYIRVESVNLLTNQYLGNDGFSVNKDANGISYSGSLPVTQSGSFYGATGEVPATASFFQGITTNTVQPQGVSAADYNVALSLLTNRDEYQFNIISTPGLLYNNSNVSSTVNSFITLAEERGDCIAVVDLVPTGSAISTVTNAAASLNSSYAATYWPWLQVRSATGRNEWVPAGTVIPGVYAFTDASSAPWFAPAGLVRGGIGGVIQAERKLTKGDRDNLYAAKVNPIGTFPGSGIAVFGQKTLQTKASALDRVNVRRLLIELKKFIGDQARNLVFEQNTIATRNKFLATVNPYLETVVQRQGLYAYRVIMDDSNNTADVVDRNQLVGQILIQPAKTVEYVVLDFTVEPTGATFN